MTRRKLPVSAALWTLLAVACIGGVGGLAVYSVRENSKSIAAIEPSSATGLRAPPTTDDTVEVSSTPVTTTPTTAAPTSVTTTAQPPSSSPTTSPSAEASTGSSLTSTTVTEELALRETNSTVVETSRPVEPDSQTSAELGRTNARAVFRVTSSGCNVESTGTAWAIDDRHLVTNGHVVNIDMSPIIQTRSGIRIQAEVVAWERAPDIAVLRVDVDLEPVEGWAPTGDILEGSDITAVGYQLPDLAFTVIGGQILSFGVDGGRRVAINADAPVERGVSGAPVFGSDGRVVGVVTAAVADRFSETPLASIIPASVLSDVVDDMISLAGGAEAEVDCTAFGSAAIGELAVGDCVATEPSGELNVVGCEQPHNAETYALLDHPASDGAPWPGTGKVRTFGISECESRFEAFVGLAYAFSTLEISPLLPSESSWGQGDRTIICTVRRLDGVPLVASVEGAAI